MSTLNIHISVWKYRLYLREKGPWEWALSQRVLHYLMFFLEWRGWARADRDRLEAGIGRVVSPREHSNISWHYFWNFFYPPYLWWRLFTPFFALIWILNDVLIQNLPPYPGCQLIFECSLSKFNLFKCVQYSIKSKESKLIKQEKGAFIKMSIFLLKIAHGGKKVPIKYPF